MRLLWKTTVGVLTAIGLICVLSATFFWWLAGWVYETEVTRRVYSPDRRAVAEVEVTKGGLGTVWTTRVLLRSDGERPWTVYQTKDSSFEPPLRWIGPQTLLISLPCDRFGYVSNPDDWDRHDPAARRLKVRFRYPPACA